MKLLSRTSLTLIAGAIGLLVITGAEKRSGKSGIGTPYVASPESVGFSSERLKRFCLE